MQQPHKNFESPFIAMTMDYGFKRTFGNESDTLFLRTALQALIQRPTPIRSVQFVKHTFEGMTSDSRSGIYDLACEDEAGDRFIVEMQNKEAPDFVQRMKFYGLHMLDSLVQRGEFGYQRLPKIYCIGILVRNLLPGSAYKSVINLRDEQGMLVDEQLTLIIVELAKFNRLESEVQSNLDKLLYTMKTIDKPTATAPNFWEEEWLSGAIRQLDTRRMSPDERAAYSIAYARQMEAIYQAKREREQSKQEGLTEGREEGREQGREGEKRAVIVNGTKIGLTITQLAALVSEDEQYVRDVLKAIDG